MQRAELSPWAAQGAQAVFCLAPVGRGSLARSSGPALTRQHHGSEWSEHPTSLQKDLIYTLVGAAARMSHVEGRAAAMAELVHVVP